MGQSKSILPKCKIVPSIVDVKVCIWLASRLVDIKDKPTSEDIELLLEELQAFSLYEWK